MTDGASEAPNTHLPGPYQETFAIEDEAGAGSLVGWVRIVIAFMTLGSLLSLGLVAVDADPGCVHLRRLRPIRRFAGGHRPAV